MGKIDLVGCINEQTLALVELKTERSKENPRRALLEILTYRAIVHNKNNFNRINDEMVAKKFNSKSCKWIQQIILAPQAYWDRWKAKKRRIRWEEFCELCRQLRDGPLKIDVQCLALEIKATQVTAHKLE